MLCTASLIWSSAPNRNRRHCPPACLPWLQSHAKDARLQRSLYYLLQAYVGSGAAGSPTLFDPSTGTAAPLAPVLYSFAALLYLALPALQLVATSVSTLEPPVDVACCSGQAA